MAKKKKSSRNKPSEQTPHTFDNWNDFKATFHHQLPGADSRGRYLFRGQRDKDWPLAPTFDRWLPDVQRAERDQLEDSLLQNFRRECEADHTLKSLLEDEVATLALAQHFGLPTRLLDWTESPYIASFFAFEKMVAAVTTMYDEAPVSPPIVIWALDTSSYVWKKNRGVEIVDPPRWQNERLRNQSGKFTLSRTPFRSLQEYVRQFPDASNALRAFLIPSGQARIAMADLDLMNINHSTLFPGRAGWAQAASMKTILGLVTSRPSSWETY